MKRSFQCDDDDDEITINYKRQKLRDSIIIPNDCLLLIFEYFNADSLLVAPYVCCTWKYEIEKYEERLWKQLCYKDMSRSMLSFAVHATASSIMNWKGLYRDHFKKKKSIATIKQSLSNQMKQMLKDIDSCDSSETLKINVLTRLNQTKQQLDALPVDWMLKSAETSYYATTKDNKRFYKRVVEWVCSYCLFTMQE
jgi:hypothetical protein